MSLKRWTVIDQSKNIQLASAQLGAADNPIRTGSPCVSVETLHGGLSEGVVRLVVDHGHWQYVVLPTRGMSLWKVWAQETCFGWNSPIRGPVHPAFVPLSEPSGLGWLDGFDELHVRCGLESNGAPEFDANGKLLYPLHGRIANRPAHTVTVEIDDETGEVIITGSVDESRFHFHKLRLKTEITSKPSSPIIQIVDSIENLSDHPAEFQLLHHINFGPPLLEPGSQLQAAARIIMPRNEHSARSIQQWNSYPAPRAGSIEQVYFLELLADENRQTQVLLSNATQTLGASVGFDVDQYRCFTLWKNPTGLSDGYVTGLEPGTNFPNPHTFEKKAGRIVSLAPHEIRSLRLRFGFHVGIDAVQATSRRIHELQRQAPPQIMPLPDPRWCA